MAKSVSSGVREVIEQLESWRKEGADCRDSGGVNSHPADSLASYMHSWGWVIRDLRIALDVYREEAPREDAGYPPVSGAVYEDAVKGRQDFRNAYRRILPVLRAGEAIARLWRSPQTPFQVSNEFADAINALDVAVTGGRAKPDWSHTTKSREDAGDVARLREALCVVRGSVGDLRKGFAKSVDPARWVDQTIAYIDAALATSPTGTDEGASR